MRPIEAKNDLGPCGGCGVNMDRGEWVVFYSAGTTHAGCIPRGAAKAIQTQTQSSGLLFDDGDLGTVEKVKEGLQTFGCANRVAVRSRSFSNIPSVCLKHQSFDGASVLGIDTPRLAGQLAKVFELMRDGRFRTLTQIAEATGCLETSAGARLRDLRKFRFGAHNVLSRQALGSPPGVREYRLITNEARGLTGGQHAA